MSDDLKLLAYVSIAVVIIVHLGIFYFDYRLRKRFESWLSAAEKRVK
jgi:hypothetical protein